MDLLALVAMKNAANREMSGKLQNIVSLVIFECTLQMYLLDTFTFE